MEEGVRELAAGSSGGHGPIKPPQLQANREEQEDSGEEHGLAAEKMGENDEAAECMAAQADWESTGKGACGEADEAERDGQGADAHAEAGAMGEAEAEVGAQMSDAAFVALVQNALVGPDELEDADEDGWDDHRDGVSLTAWSPPNGNPLLKLIRSNNSHSPARGHCDIPVFIWEYIALETM
jgi:hypothetical protein